MSGMQSMMPGGGGAPDAMAGMNRMAGGGGGGMNGMMSPNMMQSGMVGMMHGGHGMQVSITSIINNPRQKIMFQKIAK
jgi:hypothetical protein